MTSLLPPIVENILLTGVIIAGATAVTMALVNKKPLVKRRCSRCKRLFGSESAGTFHFIHETKQSTTEVILCPNCTAAMLHRMVNEVPGTFLGMMNTYGPSH